MPFEAGSRLGPYQIVGKIGAGGMGEVFRARDTRLDRDVAIKVLPDAFVKDAERVARFEREAKSVAALSHPNVLAIFDTGRQDGPAGDSALFVVTELLVGETLRDRLAQGALPVRRAVDCAVQIARGLAAAHDKGLVHRDLKPENVFLLPDGQVKILDFGLARPVSMGSGSGATQTVAVMTDPGTVMGTVGYMAPEQVRGQPVDGRGDVFALGAVLYEMVGGSRAFLRDTNAETMTAILKEDPPDLAVARPDVPSSINRIIRHCLEKNPAERFQSARDVAFALESLSASGPVLAAPEPRRVRSNHPLGIAAALAIVAAAGWAVGHFGSSGVAGEATGLIRLDVSLPDGDAFGSGSLALSPDGGTLYFVVSRRGGSQVFRRRLDSAQAEAVAGTESARHVAIAPDGAWLAFNSPPATLRRMAVSGGPSEEIATAGSIIAGITVGADGQIFFGTQSSGLFSVAPGQQPRLIVPAGDLGPPRFPVVLPDDRGLLFTVGSGTPVSNRIAVLARGAATPKVITSGTDAAYVHPGHLMFWRDGGLWAAPFDLANLSLTGPAVPIAPTVAVRGAGRAGYTVSRNGTLAYIEAAPAPPNTLTWVDHQGRETPLEVTPGPYVTVRLSPDDTRLLLAYRNEATEDIWIHDISRGVTEAFVAEPASEWNASWTADGDRVVFTSRREGPFRTFVKRANGLGDIEPLGISAASLFDDTLDGMLIANRGPALFNLTTKATTELWSENVVDAQISPDRRWIAYAASAEGSRAVWVRPYPAVESDRWRVSVRDGLAVHWSADGKTLYYRQGPDMMAVSIRPGPTFASEPPRRLFAGPYLASFDIARDGRFLMIKEPGHAQTEHRIVVVLNWPATLR